MSVSLLEPHHGLKQPEVCPADCEAVQAILSRLGDKWTVPIVAALGDRTLRFKSLHRSIDGISQRVLTASLKNLERDGLMVRRAYSAIPPRVEYELSPRGKSLRVTLEPLVDWVAEHWPSIEIDRSAFDARSKGIDQSF